MEPLEIFFKFISSLEDFIKVCIKEGLTHDQIMELYDKVIISE